VENENIEVYDNEEQPTKATGLDLLLSFFEIGEQGSIPLPNITHLLDDDTLIKVGHNVANGYQADLESMTEWSDYVKTGKELVKQEQHGKDTPWQGASNYKTPTLMQAALKWSDRAASELLRQENIVKASIIGKDKDGQKEKQAERVTEYMNYQINVEMDEWRDEHENILYTIPYDGTAFKDTFFDPRLGRPVSNIIKAPNFVVNNKIDSIERMRRFSEIIELSHNEVIERQNQGLWLDVCINSDHEAGEDSKEDEQAEADKYTKFIQQKGFFDLDGDGYEEPYTFVVSLSSKKVVRIMPRFELSDVIIKEETTLRAIKLTDTEFEAFGISSNTEIVRIKPNNTITKYGFLRDPQGGFLDVGYSYILGALCMGINTTTNQLFDAGTLANRQGGWLARGFRRKMGDSAFRPGEWKQTDIPAIDMAQGIIPLPVKEPSPTLFSLSQLLRGEAQDLSASADLTKALGANAPATTTLALVQEQQQSASAIILRVYRAMASEFKKIFDINSKYADPEEYITVLDDPEADYMSDFNPLSLNMVPSANPEISSKIQRIQQAEAELSRIDLVGAVGGNVRELTKRFYESLGTQNVEEIFPELNPQEQLQKLSEDEQGDILQAVYCEGRKVKIINYDGELLGIKGRRDLITWRDSSIYIVEPE